MTEVPGTSGGRARKMSELEKTIDLLEEMDDDQLQAIQSVAKILMLRKADNDIMTPKTEDQLLAQIDHSLAQIQAGRLVDTEEFDSRMEAMLHS